MPSAVCVPVADEEVGNRALVPFLNLSQNCLQIIRNRLPAFASVLDCFGFHSHRVGKIRLARRAVDLVHRAMWHGVSKLDF